MREGERERERERERESGSVTNIHIKMTGRCACGVKRRKG